MDLSPVSTLNLVEAEPDNCEFMVGDITQGSLEDFDDGSADLIHSRYTQTSSLLLTLVDLFREVSGSKNGKTTFARSTVF